MLTINDPDSTLCPAPSFKRGSKVLVNKSGPTAFVLYVFNNCSACNALPLAPFPDIPALFINTFKPVCAMIGYEIKYLVYILFRYIKYLNLNSFL